MLGVQLVTECLIPLAKQCSSERLARSAQGDAGSQPPAHRLSFGSAALHQGFGHLHGGPARGGCTTIKSNCIYLVLEFYKSTSLPAGFYGRYSTL